MQSPTSSISLLVWTALLASAATLAGCGKAESKAAPTQVAAKVNGDEISVHQINAVLAKATGVTNENAPQARKEVLERLVARQLAVEQALAKKLDRNPDVLSSIEAARHEILARAYLEQVAAAAPKATEEEIQRYFDEHPDLFAKRRIYTLQELVIQKSSGAVEGLQELAKAGKSMDDIAAWLKARNIPARGNAGNRAAEQLPLELLPRMAALRDGQTAVIDAPQVLYVMHLVSSRAAPVDEAAAKPRIQQFLQNQHHNKAVTEEMKKLRDAAKIEYVGDFATLAQAPAAAPPAAALTAAQEASPALPLPGGDKASAGALEKGVAGLK